MFLGLQGEAVEVDPGGWDVGVVVVRLHDTPVRSGHQARPVGRIELDLGVPEGVGSVVPDAGSRPGRVEQGVLAGTVREVGPAVGAVLDVRVGADRDHNLLTGVGEGGPQAERATAVVRLRTLVLNLFDQIFVIELREHFSFGLCIPRLSAYLHGHRLYFRLSFPPCLHEVFDEPTTV